MLHSEYLIKLRHATIVDNAKKVGYELLAECLIPVWGLYVGGARQRV